VFCANDVLALGAMRRFRAHGLHAPRDYKIASIDDVEEASFSEPPLTTVAIDRHWMIETAFSLLGSELQHPTVPARQLETPFRLLVREST
jgi:DNA-binding LacI/PurR family transcriptional regulator